MVEFARICEAGRGAMEVEADVDVDRAREMGRERVPPTPPPAPDSRREMLGEGGAGRDELRLECLARCVGVLGAPVSVGGTRIGEERRGSEICFVRGVVGCPSDSTSRFTVAHTGVVDSDGGVDKDDIVLGLLVVVLLISSLLLSLIFTSPLLGGCAYPFIDAVTVVGDDVCEGLGVRSAAAIVVSRSRSRSCFFAPAEPFGPGRGILFANSCELGMGGGRKDEDGEGNPGEAEGDASSATERCGMSRPRSAALTTGTKIEHK